MEMHITATDQTTSFDGVPVRLWKGVTSKGVECHVFVHRIAVANDADQSQFDDELLEQMPPAAPSVPLHLIL